MHHGLKGCTKLSALALYVSTSKEQREVIFDLPHPPTPGTRLL